MDNLCHSFAGAAIAHCGWSRRLPRASVLAIIAANIPDVDAFTYLFADAPTAVWFRRGWTHGIPALVVWALLLAALFSWWERQRPSAAPPIRARIGTYLPLAAIAVASHPALDWLNTYGVRLLMPFSDRWFYGDTLFIVDPALLGLLAAAWIVGDQVGGRRHAAGVAATRAVVALAVAYIAVMKGLSVATRDAARDALHLGDTSPRALVVSPTPISLTRRELLVRRGDVDERFIARVTRAGIAVDTAVVRARNGDTPDHRARALVNADGRKFLAWARFPYFVPGTGADSGTIFLGDARYSDGTTPSWAGIRIRD